MSEQAPPKIEFPCENYPIKIMGDKDGYRDKALAMIARHAPDFDASEFTERDSRNGKYISITVKITATSKTQLEAIFADLKTLPQTRMVL